jgi:uncharacterized repeat protein (TIGR03803 family)
MPTLTTLVKFNGANGNIPAAGLMADAAGDLFGATESGGVYGDGTVFEIVQTGSGYAAALTTLASFNGTNGEYPLYGSLIADAFGDLFGTTVNGAANGDGTVFEIVQTGEATQARRPRWRASTGPTGTILQNEELWVSHDRSCLPPLCRPFSHASGGQTNADGSRRQSAPAATPWICGRREEGSLKRYRVNSKKTVYSKKTV